MICAQLKKVGFFNSTRNDSLLSGLLHETRTISNNLTSQHSVKSNLIGVNVNVVLHNKLECKSRKLLF